MIYGATGPLVTMPLDTVITKMQTASATQQQSAMNTARAVIRDEGIRGLYRGLPFPLIGSTCMPLVFEHASPRMPPTVHIFILLCLLAGFRSTQFAVYNSAYAAMDRTALAADMPFTSGLQGRVLLAGLASSFARAVIETPFEVMKVRRQVGQDWRVGPAMKDIFSMRQVFAFCVNPHSMCVCTNFPLFFV
jgi:hypothetical protein